MVPPAFEATARVVVAILANSLWQGALIALATWLALRLFPKANASTRYAAWALALLAIVLIPVATSLSRVCIATQQASPPPVQQRTAVPVVRENRPLHASVKPPTSTATSAPSLQLTVPSFAAAVVFALWLFAAAAVLVRLLIAFVQLERLKHNSLPLDVAYRDAMPRWSAAVKGDRDIRICVSEAIDVPIAVGIFDSMILLPAKLVQALDSEEVDQITLHELAHLLRNDDWTNGLQRLAGALLFFNPAVWFVSRQLDLEREVACDDYVLELTGAVRPYAFCLTKMAEMTSWPHRPLPAPGVFVTRKNISIRIERLLRTGRAIGSRIAPSVASAVVVALIAVFFALRTMTPSIAFTRSEAPQQPAVAPAVTHSVAHAAVRVVAAVPTASATPAATIAPAVAVAPQPTPQVHVRVQLPARSVKVTIPAVHVDVPMPDVSAIVAQTTRAWGGERDNAESPSGRCNGCDFGRANLAGKDFSHRNLTGSNFGSANLNGARFDHAHLEGVNFAHADLRNASFAGAHMTGCNLGDAQISGARFDGADVTGCNIDISQLDPEQARNIVEHCTGCDFARAHLAGMDLRGLRLTGVNLSGADLHGSDLRNARFAGVNFNHANLNGARLDGARFEGCDFTSVDLRNVDLSRVNLTGSDLHAAILRD